MQLHQSRAHIHVAGSLKSVLYNILFVFDLFLECRQSTLFQIKKKKKCDVSRELSLWLCPLYVCDVRPALLTPFACVACVFRGYTFRLTACSFGRSVPEPAHPTGAARRKAGCPSWPGEHR